MDRRFLLFLVLATLLLLANMQLVRWLNPQPELPKDGVAAPADATAKDEVRQPLEAPPVDRAQPKPAAEAVEETVAKRKWVALGSADPSSPYQMLVVLTSRGAGVEWAGLNSEKYLDLEALFEKRGYLGYLALTPAPEGGGAVVNVVGPGSPARGHLQPLDIITSIKSERDKETTPIKKPDDLESYLTQRSRFDEPVNLQVIRKGQSQTITITLGKRPLELLKPDQAFDPALSFLLTLAEVERPAAGPDGAKKDDAKKLELKKETGIEFVKGGSGEGAVIESVQPGSPAEKAGLRAGDRVVQLDDVKIHKFSEFNDALAGNTVPTGAYLDVTFQRGDAAGTSAVRLALPPELPGVNLYTADWEIKPGNSDAMVEFHRTLPLLNLEVVKRYTLAPKVETEQAPAGPGYHLTLDVEINKIAHDGAPLQVAYQLDGPQGLPTEGWWYANKISRTSGAAGARDVMYNLDRSPNMYNAPELGRGAKFDVAVPSEHKFVFVADDARYVAAAILPRTGQVPIQLLQPLIVGSPEKDRPQLTNTSFRLITDAVELKDQPLHHSYTIFLGPKEREVLAQPEYQLSELVYYGWTIFAVPAQLMVGILHFFYDWVPIHNYGIAIILLTVLVRLCMFPLSRKQALGAQKMQKLQPELKRLTEKHKNDYEGRAKAQRELFRKHNYNPAAGCLPIFVQLPIFMGLYRALSVATELRQAPLIEGLYWCSDLSAPDRLFHWQALLPDFLASETGFLGPYFNLLPIITIVLFLVQQKMFMPPPTDEQQKMQQKMMTFMMIFMGFMFFKVPSGLCIYFIASSLWGIAERKLLPKISHETEESAAPAAAEARKAAQDKGRPRGAEPQGGGPGAASQGAAPQGLVQRTAGRLGGTVLGKLFKSLSQAADNQPRTEAGKRRPKKRGKGNK